MKTVEERLDGKTTTILLNSIFDILEKTKDCEEERLADKITTILLDTIFDILKKTKDCEAVRVYKIACICNCCCNILTDSRIIKEWKIDIFENLAKDCVDDVDKMIEKYNS